MEAKVLNEEPSLRGLQEELALLNRKSGWIACLSYLNRHELASVEGVEAARAAMEEELG